MTNYKLSQLTSAVPAAADLIPFIDVDDTSTAPAGSGGSDKVTTVANVLALANVVSLNGYGADPTGATFSDTAMAAAQAAGGSAYVIAATPGTYKFANSYQFGPSQGIATGQQNLAVIFNYTGSGVFITSHDPSFNTSSTTPLQSICGPMTGFTIDGSSAGAGAKGIRIGDQNLPDVSIGVRHFNGAGSIGGWLDSQVGWVNYGTIAIATEDCTNHIVFDNTGGLATFGGINFNFDQTAAPNQNGVVLKNAAQVGGPGIFQLGGAYSGGSSNTGTVLSIGADSTGVSLRGMLLNINCESANSTGTVGPVPVALGSNGFFGQNTGQLVFRNTSANFQVSTGLQYTYRYSFSGIVSTDTGGDYLVQASNNGIGLVTYGSALWTIGSATPTDLYSGTGDLFQTQLANGANTMTVHNSVASVFQRMRLEVQQPSSGAAGTLTISGATTPPGGLTLSTANNAVDVIELWYDGSVLYACVMGDRFNAVADAEQFTCLTAAYTLANSTSAQKLFNATTNGTLTVAASTSYFFECEFDITGLSASSHQVEFGLGGTATLTSLKYLADSNTGAAGTLAAWQTIVVTSASATALMAAGTTTTFQARLRGVIRVNAAGTIIPQVTQLTASAAASVTANSYFRAWPVGSNTVASVGNWS